MGRAPCCEKVGLKKGAWTPEEDQKLVNYINENGHGSWRALPKKAGLLRCGKSCRLRWTNYLRPDIKRGEFSATEEQTIIQLHALLGNRWSAIASHLPKRTDNEIKNYWNTHLKKRLSKMGIDPTTHKPKSDILSSNSALVGVEGAGAVCNSALSHMVQWESARLAAEARLARESKLRTEGLWPISATTTSSSISNNSSPLGVEAHCHHQCYHPSTGVAGAGGAAAASGARGLASSAPHLGVQGEQPAVNGIELMNTLQNWEKSLQGQAGLMWPDSWRSTSSATAAAGANANVPPPPPQQPQPAASVTDNSSETSTSAGLITSCCSSPPYSHSTQYNYTSSCCNVDKQLDQASSPTSTLCTSSWPECNYADHSDNHRRQPSPTSSLDRHNIAPPHEASAAAAAHCSSPSNTSSICSTAAAATNIIVSPKLSWSDILPSAAAAPVSGLKPAIIDILRQSKYSYVSSGAGACCSAEGTIKYHHTGELRAESMTTTAHELRAESMTTTAQLGARQHAAASPTSFQDLLFEVVSRPWVSSSSSCQYSGPSTLLDSNFLKQQRQEQEPLQPQLELEDHSHNSATTPSLRHEQLIGEFADISSDADMSSCCVKSNEEEEDLIMADLSKSFIASTSSSRPVTFSALLNEDFPDYWSNMLKDVHDDDVVDEDAPHKIIHEHMADHPTKESNGES